MADKKQAKSSIIDQVAERLRTCDNVLVALSKDPSVDDLSAALGLTFILDKMGKHATAIFSGAVPNAIEFLEPEKTFETNTNSLQDFIIALDKEKADHLRYKIDGDYVKVYITPYRTHIEESDLEFSHGDYNVDLVVALNVASAEDLDSALSEYGRIMHDASSINIQADVAGNFADLEWGDPNASSVSEMIYRVSEKLSESGEEDVPKKLLDKSTSTALLAGIVAATNRFSNEHTMPETLAAASKLMMAGADQQLISSSIPVDILTSDVVDATEDAKATEDTKAAEAPKTEIVADLKKDDKEEMTLEDELEALEKNEEVAAETDVKATEAPATKPEKTEKTDKVDKAEQAKEAAEKKAAEAAEEATEAAEQAAEEEQAEEAEKPAAKKEAPDPTALEIRHGAVDFELDENGEEKAPEAAPAETATVEAAPEVAAPAPEAAPAPAPEAPVVAPVMPAPVAPAPEAPAAPAASSVIIEPEVTHSEEEKPAHVAEPLSEADYNAEDHSAENAIDAALQKAAAAARQNEAAATSAAEAAAAAAQLNQLVAANAAAAAQPISPAVTELAAGGKMNITPPSEAMQAPKVSKDYAAMMSEALAEPLPAPVPAMPAPMPVEAAPMMAPQMPAQMPSPAAMPMPAQMPAQMPTQAQMPAPAPEAAPAPMQEAPAPMPQMPAPAEYATPLPMPDPNGILPPAPAPFAPDATAPVANPAELPTAQAFVEQLQANNPAVQSVPAAPAPMPQMPAPAPAAMPMPAEAPVAPIMPAVPDEEPTLSNGMMASSPALQGVNPVMQDQIYPTDPSAFHIPGM